MTLLKRAIGEERGLLLKLKVPSIAPSALTRVVESISGSGSNRNAEEIASLQKRLFQTIQSSGAETLSRRDLREGCKVFLMPPTPLAQDRKVADSLINVVSLHGRRGAFFALLDTYLDGFHSNSPEIQHLAKRLSQLATVWPWRDSDKWPQRIRSYALLDPAEAPERISSTIMGSDEGVKPIMDIIGLTTKGRQLGGLSEAAFMRACKAISIQVGESVLQKQQRLIDWAILDGAKLAYPTSWPLFAAALFIPWRGGEPPASHKNKLIETAIEFAGDPRINTAKWTRVKDAVPDAYNTLLRWLTKASVDQFFDIVTQSTDRLDMWKERRRFWTRYLDANLIQAAWVVFGDRGASLARQAAHNTGDKGLVKFGRLGSGGGRTPEHAALMMRIGDLTIVDWSHNGRWNIWPKEAKKHPDLFRHNAGFRADYQPHELMNAPKYGSHVGNWQYKVDEIIRYETGLRP